MSISFVPLLADSVAHSPAGWTDKEVIIYVLSAVGGTLVAIIPIAWGLVKILTAAPHRRVAILEQENLSLRDALDEAGGGEAIKEVSQKLKDATVSAAHLEATLAGVREQAEGFEQAAKGLEGERDELKKQLAEATDELTAHRRRIERATKKDGATWTEKMLSTAPDFRPLDPEGRRTPIISVLNLKGGVGKTTATANLGAALARRGWRVLLLDLDLQGSLTSLFLTEARQQERHEARRLAGDFLESAFDAEFPNLLDYAVPVMEGEGRCSLVPTADEMAYAETNLTVRWFLKDSTRDPRFLLRRELHLKRVTNEFDVVLLDCPPFINISCVNALAASDYVLAPVMPSKQATDRVTILLERLKEFRENLNPSLQVMGFFANRTKESELTSGEKNRLSALEDKCKDAWSGARRFKAFIRQSADVRNSEDERRPLGPGDELYHSFVKLAREVEDCVPTFCLTAAEVPSEKGVPS